MDSLIECIRANTHSRTLASPKVSVVNHQEAKIQIGERLPYAVATTTQTATIQNVQFLDVGIVLTVTPVITADGNILMTVLPKVSGGRITENGFPEEDTTEVSTTVLMKDGSGLVIGGLIRENEGFDYATTPVLGKIPVMGRLFRKRNQVCQRDELIIALVTRILEQPEGPRDIERLQLTDALPEDVQYELHYPIQMAP
jgi:type II secretory pathway component HofQ